MNKQHIPRHNFSDYVVYVDESGDHGLVSIDPQYPIFCLAFCIFKQTEYIKDIAPALNMLKYTYWGHCDVVLHERDIRKNRKNDWSLLGDKETRVSFLSAITVFIEQSPFHILACVIRKKALQNARNQKNPYELAMRVCMEELHGWLLSNNQHDHRVHVQFESRGKKEDKDLELEFRRICDNQSSITAQTDFSRIEYVARFLDKKVNSTGLQVADLVARPIGMHLLDPHQPNRAFDVIAPKLMAVSDGYQTLA